MSDTTLTTDDLTPRGVLPMLLRVGTRQARRIDDKPSFRQLSRTGIAFGLLPAAELAPDRSAAGPLTPEPLAADGRGGAVRPAATTSPPHGSAGPAHRDDDGTGADPPRPHRPNRMTRSNA